MRAAILRTPRRQPKGEWGPMRWLMLILVWLLFAASSGCAGRLPRTNVDPRIELPANLRAPCLRGRLPDGAELSVGEALSQWVEAEARAVCEQGRAEEIVGVIDRFNAEWEALDGRRRRR